MRTSYKVGGTLAVTLLLAGCHPAPAVDPAPAASLVDARSTTPLVVSAREARVRVPLPGDAWWSWGGRYDYDAIEYSWGVFWMNAAGRAGQDIGGFAWWVETRKGARRRSGSSHALVAAGHAMRHSRGPAGTAHFACVDSLPELRATVTHDGLLLRLGPSPTLTSLQRARPDSVEIAVHAAERVARWWVPVVYR